MMQLIWVSCGVIIYPLPGIYLDCLLTTYRLHLLTGSNYLNVIIILYQTDILQEIKMIKTSPDSIMEENM